MLNNRMQGVNSLIDRAVGLSTDEMREMLSVIGLSSIEELISQTIPEDIRCSKAIDLGKVYGETEYLEHIREIAARNQVFRSYIGAGYYGSMMPAVIARNIFENPDWYTSYTPYQAEISQGRLEALFNFQTMVASLTGMCIANASLLDEATSAAEAMGLQFRTRGNKQASKYIVIGDVFPQTLALIQTRAQFLGIEIVTASLEEAINQTDEGEIFGMILQCPSASGEVVDYAELGKVLCKTKITLAVATDLLSLCLLKPPGSCGAHIVVGSSQRFGMPMGYGGPHAGFMATIDAYKRNIPGRIIGLSIDKNGDKAYRMALQTREQHIKRHKATSNICTAQALPAIISSMYAVYHGPARLESIAKKVNTLARTLAAALRKLGLELRHKDFFDTICIVSEAGYVQKIKDRAIVQGINFYYPSNGIIQISLDENTCLEDIENILEIFYETSGIGRGERLNVAEIIEKMSETFSDTLLRRTPFLQQKVFNKYHSEHEILRYMKRLENKDISLSRSMISLGSCTMKLNPTTTMLPISWPEFSEIHPFAPREQALGYEYILSELGRDLLKLTGLDAISFQPNSGANGEYAGLLAIREYFKSTHQEQRNIIFIPASAHGTNPASAAMAGLEIVVIKCNEAGEIDIADVRQKAQTYGTRLAAIMITYPSTHGVFESGIKAITALVHEQGGQVYIDGANMNAQLGLVRISDIGGDVCHLNLHKTFATPHGGGGPGAGPICVASHLAPFLPTHPFAQDYRKGGVTVSGAPFGNALVLVIAYGYIKMMGGEGLKTASQIAILNANYLRAVLAKAYKILYTGTNGYCAHEFILDCREFQKLGIEAIDIAKRLIDFGFHAPTVSFPVSGTLMIEPTESESKEELDRFCEALLDISGEIGKMTDKKVVLEESLLKNAPFTTSDLASEDWPYPFSRKEAAFPASWLRNDKYFAPVKRINDSFGDRNLECTCC